MSKGQDMTPEERATAYFRLLRTKPQLIEAFRAAESAARAEERGLCMADVCVGCRRGWPVHSLSGRMYFHLLPQERLDRGADPEVRCEAGYIRARSAATPADAGGAST